jgi:hypothetical protein
VTTGLLGDVGAPKGTRGELAHDHGCHHVDGESQPVLRLREIEMRGRLEEEPVEGDHADDRDGERIRQAPQNRHGQHREHVQDAKTQDRDVGLENRDRPGHQRDAGSAPEEAQHHSRP